MLVLVVKSEEGGIFTLVLIERLYSVACQTHVGAGDNEVTNIEHRLYLRGVLLSHECIMHYSYSRLETYTYGGQLSG